MTRRIVFVTGGAGFIGSNIVAKLAEDRNLDVVVCDRLRGVELGKWRNIAKHPIADFVLPEAMFDWLEQHWRDVEAVVHMGAVSSTTEPDATSAPSTSTARWSNRARAANVNPTSTGSASTADRRET